MEYSLFFFFVNKCFHLCLIVNLLLQKVWMIFLLVMFIITQIFQCFSFYSHNNETLEHINVKNNTVKTPNSYSLSFYAERLETS